MKLLLLFILTCSYAFINGFNDSPSIVSPVISTRALNARLSLFLTAIGQVTGPFLIGTAVARTVATRIVLPSSVNLNAVLAALVAALVWSLFTWYLALPSSTSHALVGGMIGAVIAVHGIRAVILAGFLRVLGALLLSPPLGLLVSYLAVRIIRFLARDAKPRFNRQLQRWEPILMVLLGVTHGASDAPKSFGIMILGLMAMGVLKSFTIPIWVLLPCLASFALGTSVGGWRQINTLANRIYHIRPLHGFASLIASSLVVFGAASVGGPISTSQVVASAILGAGAGERLNMVRWLILKDMLIAWVITIPATGLIALSLTSLFGRIS
ncbi:MAG: anion permease [Anaerolineales bacterium]